MLTALMIAAAVEPTQFRADWWENRIGSHFVEEVPVGGVQLRDGFYFGFIQGEIDLPAEGRWLVTIPVQAPIAPDGEFVSLRINGEEIAIVEAGATEVSARVSGSSFFYNFEFLTPLEENATIAVKAGMLERLCDADINGDRMVDVLDLVAFHQAYLAGDPLADCNADGEISVLDYICFQPKYRRACD